MRQASSAWPWVRHREFIFWLALGAAAAGLAAQLLLHPLTGLANNGDFERVISIFGLQSTYTAYYDKYFYFVNRLWVFAPPLDAHFYTSQQLLIAIGAGLARLLPGGEFDIRWMGLLNGLALLAGLAAGFGGLLLGKFRFGLLGVLMGLLFFLDSGYVTYLNSFYSEPLALAALLALVGLAVLILAVPEVRRQPAWALAGFWLAAVLLATSKNLFTPAALLFAWIGGRLGQFLPAPARLRRLLAWGPAGGLVILCVLFPSLAVPPDYSLFNRYNSVFTGILNTSNNPAADLAELGVPAKYAYFSGFDFWDVDPAFKTTPQFTADFYERVGWGEILRFYLAHPGRFLDLAALSAPAGVLLSPDELGQFEASAGLPPRTHSQEFSLWSSVRVLVLPSSLAGLGLFFLVALGAALFKRLRLDRDPPSRLLSELQLAVLLAALIQFGLALLSDGQNEITKHLFLYNALCDVSLIFLVVELANFTAGSWKNLRSAQPR